VQHSAHKKKATARPQFDKDIDEKRKKEIQATKNSCHSIANDIHNRPLQTSLETRTNFMLQG
jgi:hypothetical protein